MKEKREGKGEERRKETKKKGTKVMTQSHLSLLKITSTFVLAEAKQPTVTVSPKEYFSFTL